MPCEGCAVQFSVFKRKRVCCECERYYCSGCLRRGGGAMCAPCRVLSTRPLYRNTISHLKVRDLQCFLQRQNVSTRGCVEKEELINLCVVHVNGATYRRRGARSTGAFSSLKGLTNNINDFINNAFDLRAAPTHAPAQSPEPAANTRNCFNSTHAHRPPASPGDPPDTSRPTSPPRPQSERFTTTPGGEADIRPEVPPAGGAARSPSVDSARVDTADCFEIEDLDDSTWELVARPAEPLPNDSDILLRAMDEAALRGQATEEAAGAAEVGGGARDSGADFVRVPAPEPQRWARAAASGGYSSPDVSLSGGLGARAASELELRSAAPTHEPAARRAAASSPASPRHVTLEQMERLEELEALSVKQLKELLTRNRVEYRGCLERDDLLQRARLLWRTHSRYRDASDAPSSPMIVRCVCTPIGRLLPKCVRPACSVWTCVRSRTVCKYILQVQL